MKRNTIKKPFVFTIFGASGDLAKRMIFPSLYHLAYEKRLPKEFYIVGYARSKKTQKEFQKEFLESLQERVKESNYNEKIAKSLVEHVYYFTGKYDKEKSYKEFRHYLQTTTKKKNITNVLYFSVPPVVFKDIILNVSLTRTNHNEDWRLILEKPFGNDTESAKELFHFVCSHFNEHNVYLLDHYLGKGPVQSILSMRHANRILNMLLQGTEVANIQITAEEDIGVDNRIGYFDKVGTLKDMVQSHLLQILAMITMAIPITDTASSLHREKYSILSALQFPQSPKNIVLGQYKSYKKNKEVQKSHTETFVAARLFLDRESWYKVPLYVRTGKKLREKHAYIVVEFKKFSFQKKEEPNRLIIELQPEERISIRMVNSFDGITVPRVLESEGPIACSGDHCLPEHAKLLLDAIAGSKVNFLSFPEILATWRVTDTILKMIQRKKVKVETYEDGTEGPKSQHKLTQMDGFEWFDVPLSNC